MDLYFSDFFEVSEDKLDEYGAFNVSLITDLPLFIDPFLLFNSEKPEYKTLHNEMIKYLQFLRDKSSSQKISPGLLKAWFYFSEVKENWLGFCVSGNSGRGLGGGFASSLSKNLRDLFPEFGEESITQGSHIEKLCLIESGVGRDTISDFTTNLIKDYLLNYTQKFALEYINPKYRYRTTIDKVRFNYITETWVGARFELPFYNGNYLLLTPKDILTKDDTWINKADLNHRFYEIPDAIPDEQLRAQINNYFRSCLPRNPKKKDIDKAAGLTILKFPDLIDYYIKLKEEKGEQAARQSYVYVQDSEQRYIKQFGELVDLLASQSEFYKIPGNTKEEALARINFLKDVIENKGGHRIFYHKGQPIRKEEDLQILYRLTWFATPSDISREVNDGRGPVDFKVSRGSQDKTLIEMKLASNSQLKRNLQKQVDIYQKASDASFAYKVIIYFTLTELNKVLRTLHELKQSHCDDIILIDARKDNKLSASKA